MFRNLLKVTAAVAAVVGLNSCGGNGGQQLSSTSVATVLGSVSTQLLGKLPRSNTISLPISGASLAAHNGPLAAATDCETVSPASPVDADSDGYALTKTGTFNCTDRTIGSNSWTRVGTWTVTDKNDAVAGLEGGLKVVYNVTSYNYLDTTSGSQTDGSYVGNWDFNYSGGVYSSTSDFHGHYGYTSTTYSIVTDYDFWYTWDWTQTPDSTAAPWTTGAQEFSGSYRFSGKFDHEDNGGNHKQMSGTFELKYYSSNLRYDSACTKWYKSGSIFFDDYNGSIFEVRYSCSTAQLYINGTASSLWTP